jgi:hypothetical protein
MDYHALAIWALGREVGASSKCIARHMLGLPTDGSYPHDSGDFGRCEALLGSVPELRARLPEMASVNSYWAAIVPHWDAIRDTPDTTAAIRAIIHPLQDKDQRVVRLGNGATLHFGGPK